VNVIINDTAGRAWRNGVMGFALGTAGFEPVVDLIGHQDMFGNILQITQVAVADELAAAASFVMGQADEATPVVLIRGARLTPSEKNSSSLIRQREHDLFR
jgi:coenzyme F420-0:L-glutamate ligase/coenzyme F420-1:gamma-L-glutamate ligase